nr:retrovirus-related Pol polyprotein from transposon TNT 1-94 [Tanacetum cinerariifolium]
MLTRAMDKELSAASVHECLFVDILSKEEPKKVSKALKHPGRVDAMQDELNQFSRNKVSGTQSADMALLRGLTWDLHADVACHVATLTGGPVVAPVTAGKPRGTTQVVTRCHLIIGYEVRIKAGLVYVGPWGMAGGLVNGVGPKMGKQVLVEPR